MLTGPIGYGEGMVRRVDVTFVTSHGVSGLTCVPSGGGVEIDGWRGQCHLKVRDRPVVASGVACRRCQFPRDLELPGQERPRAFGKVGGHRPQTDGRRPRVTGPLLEDTVDRKHVLRLRDVHFEVTEGADPSVIPMRGVARS